MEGSWRKLVGKKSSEGSSDESTNSKIDSSDSNNHLLPPLEFDFVDTVSRRSPAPPFRTLIPTESLRPASALIGEAKRR